MNKSTAKRQIIRLYSKCLFHRNVSTSEGNDEKSSFYLKIYSKHSRVLLSLIVYYLIFSIFFCFHRTLFIRFLKSLQDSR